MNRRHEAGRSIGPAFRRQKRLAQLQARAVSTARCQEGEDPPDYASELLATARAVTDEIGDPPAGPVLRARTLARMATLRIDKRIVLRFPRITVASFRVDIPADPPLAVPEVAPADVAECLTREGVEVALIADAPPIRTWREVFGVAGLKPSTYKSSPEALARRFLKGGAIPTPLPLVNLYCAVSAKHLAPLGGYDLERLDAVAASRDVVLRFAKPGDRFAPLGGRPDDFALRSDIPVYACGSEVVCWAFNVRDSAATSLVEATRHALFVGEALNEDQSDRLISAITELRDTLQSAGFACGTVTSADATQPTSSAREPSEPGRSPLSGSPLSRYRD